MATETVKATKEDEQFPPSWSTCVICKNPPKSAEVVFFPCLHICCSSDCTDRFFDQPAPVACPECYQKVNKEALHSCSYINENLEHESKDKANSYDSQLCRSCVREALAFKWCQDCQEFLCEFCTDYHQYAKTTRSHTLAPKTEGIIELFEGSEASPSDLKCKTHVEEDLSSVCEDCNVPLCDVCNDSHSGHKIKTLEAFAEEFESEFEAGLDNVKFVQERCERAERAFDEKLKYILRDQKSSMHAEAKKVFKRLIDALLQREIQLRKDLVEITLNKAKEINIKKAKVSSIAKSCNQYISTGKDILSKGTRLNVFQHKDFLQNQYKNLDSMKPVLKDENFDDFIEADWSFEIRHEPVELAEKWIGQICEVVYSKNSKQQTGSKSDAQDKISTILKTYAAAQSPTPEKPKVLGISRNPEQQQQSKLKVTNNSHNNNDAINDAEPMDTDEAPHKGKETPSKTRRQASGGQQQQSEKLVVIKQEPKKVDSSSDGEETLPTLTPPRTRKRAISGEKSATQSSPDTDSKRGSSLALDRPRRSIKAPKDKEIDAGSPEVKKSSRIAARSRATSSEERSTGRSSSAGKTNESLSKRDRKLTLPAPLSSPKAAATTTPATVTKKGSKVVEEKPTVVTTTTTAIARKSTRGRPPKRVNKVEDEVAPVEGVSAGEVIEFPIVREEKMKISMEDENEDYCGTCLDGGEAVLICCDKCPKVFHLECHLPSLSSIPKEDFQCLFCTPYEVIREKQGLVNGEKDYLIVPKSGLSFHEFILACKFFCELYKVKESLTVRGFYDKMFRQVMNQAPISLTTLRRRLSLGTPKPFESTSSIILSLRKLLYQANIFYSTGSEENKRYLQKFQDKLEEILGIYFPLLCDLTYETEEDNEFEPLIFNGQDGKALKSTTDKTEKTSDKTDEDTEDPQTNVIATKSPEKTTTK